MRAFFGLSIGEHATHQVQTWRQRQLLCDGRLVPRENFHITLCFLGSVTGAQLSSCCDGADALIESGFDLMLDETGYFPKPRVLWIGPSRIPDALHALSHRLGGIASRAGLKVDRRPYQPHLTLMRKCRDPALETLESPSIAISCDQFSLFESRSTDNGVRYYPLATWRLEAPYMELDS